LPLLTPLGCSSFSSLRVRFRMDSGSPRAIYQRSFAVVEVHTTARPRCSRARTDGLGPGPPCHRIVEQIECLVDVLLGLVHLVGLGRQAGVAELLQEVLHLFVLSPDWSPGEVQRHGRIAPIAPVTRQPEMPDVLQCADGASNLRSDV
jgi:hypothetical protein